MPNATASTSLRKRKKTDDMPDSPPKRVTRARAAKATKDAEAAPKSTRIKSTSVIIANEAKKSTITKAPRVSKRKMQADDENDHASPEEKKTEAAEPAKARGRPKKTTGPPKQETATASTTKSQRTETGEDKTQSTVQDNKTKTRSRKVTEGVDNGQESKNVKETGPEPAKKTTRTRTAAVNMTSTASTTKPTKAKKKVAFEEPTEQDKENIPVVTRSRKPSSQETGIKAKPIRKPPVRGSTRAKAATKKTIEKQEPAALPLSPKKVTQVAKSNSTSSEDELCERSPIKAFHKSPVKTPTNSRGPFQPARESSPCSPTRNRSPTKETAETILASPARRPPPSPFKDALKESPKRFAIGVPLSQQSIEEEGKVQVSYKEPLKQSPKRFNVMSSSLTLTAPSRSSFKASLLGSPARRPMSAIKARTIVSPSKSKPGLSLADSFTPSKGTNTFKLPAAASQRLFSSPVRDTPVEGHQSTNGDTAVQHLEKDHAEEPIPATVHADQEVEAPEAAGNTSSPSLSSPQNFDSRDVFGGAQLFRSAREESDSEDELQSGAATMGSPTRSSKRRSRDFLSNVTPLVPTSKTPRSTFRARDSNSRDATDFSMTPLALQFGAWLAPSPVKHGNEVVSPPRGIFSHIDSVTLRRSDVQRSRQSTSSIAEPRFFEDQMAVQDTEPIQVLEDRDLHEDCDTAIANTEDEVHASQSSDQYGDENILPIDPLLPVSIVEPAESQVEPVTVTPARVFQSNPREIHTVSKVPLRPAAEDSPSQVPRKRSKSVSGPLAELSELPKPVLTGNTSTNSYSIEDESEDGAEGQTTPARSTSSGRRSSSMPMTPSNNAWPGLETPLKTIRKGADAQILRGAVVFVDVHTTEGADASGIFVDLLTQMGAKCIKQWTWNPRASMGSSTQTPTAPDATPSVKVGITHVVYKDGGKRTLQKVRESKDLVLCVGVGWVLE